jgi:hypothetical protein
MTHAHRTPVFGCLLCIKEDRAAWGAKSYAAWKKTYVLPRCPKCKGTMEHFEMFLNDGKYCALVVCMKLDAEEGTAACGDQDIIVELP